MLFLHPAIHEVFCCQVASGSRRLIFLQPVTPSSWQNQFCVWSQFTNHPLHACKEASRLWTCRLRCNDRFVTFLVSTLCNELALAFLYIKLLNIEDFDFESLTPLHRLARINENEVRWGSHPSGDVFKKNHRRGLEQLAVSASKPLAQGVNSVRFFLIIPL